MLRIWLIGWVSDFRYVTQRTTDGPWQPIAASMLSRCQHSSTGTITVYAWYDSHAVVSCARLNG